MVIPSVHQLIISSLPQFIKSSVHQIISFSVYHKFVNWSVHQFIKGLSLNEFNSAAVHQFVISQSIYQFIISSVYQFIISSIDHNQFMIRGAPRFQIGWIFGKVPNGLWPPSHFQKVILRNSWQKCVCSYWGTFVYYMIMRCM